MEKKNLRRTLPSAGTRSAEQQGLTWWWCVWGGVGGRELITHRPRTPLFMQEFPFQRRGLQTQAAPEVPGGTQPASFSPVPKSVETLDPLGVVSWLDTGNHQTVHRVQILMGSEEPRGKKGHPGEEGLAGIINLAQILVSVCFSF